ncbi:MAG: hypothetical protein K1Y36_07945 [Blastocatellia bacterium]|nr:hypothetical protein [Blastocatellia bacterium]
MFVRTHRNAVRPPRLTRSGKWIQRIFLVGLVWSGLAGTGWALAQAPPPPKTTETPAITSAAWYYERALVSFIFERNAEAEQDLREALRKRPKSAEAEYLLAATLDRLKRPREAMTALERALADSPVEHTPARLRLVSHLLELEKGEECVPHIEKLLAFLHVPGPEVADARIRLQMALSARPLRASEIFVLTQQLAGHINIFLLDSAAHYRAATLDAGLNDGLVILEYINLLRRQSSIKDEEVAAETQKTIRLRQGFAPAACIQLGEVEEKQNHLPQALSNFDYAIRQMKYLGFTESKGDFSADHFRDLQQKVTKTAPPKK